MMNNLKLEDYLEIVNNEKEGRGLEEFTPLYPMLRVENNKLYIGILLTHRTANVWDKEANIKPEYWVLLDTKDNHIVEWNKTDKKDFVVGQIMKKNIEDKQKEISKYEVRKKLEYKEYLMNDIKNDNLPIQQKISSILDNRVELDGEKVNIDDYLLANMEEDITNKVDELVNLMVMSKYNSLTIYYDYLFKEIIITYQNDNRIDMEKMKLCLEIMNNYYDGVIGIDNFFKI